MSIKLRFDKGSLSTQVMLKDDALPELLKIISEYQSDDSAASAPVEKLTPIGETIRDINNSETADDRIAFAKGWVEDHSAPEILKKIGWQTNAEKILLLAAVHEMTGGEESWKSSDIESHFKAAREQAPGNFGRDISTAIKEGLIAPVTPRTYKITKTGWLKIYEAVMKSVAEGTKPSEAKHFDNL